MASSNGWSESLYWLWEWINWWADYLRFQLTQNPDILGIPNGSYIVAVLLMVGVLVLLWLGLRWLWYMSGLYLLILTSKARMSRVVGHVDGDTLKVEPPNTGEDPISVRLIGVDTPESRKSMYMKIAPFGKDASDFTKQRLPRWQKIILIYDVDKKDKFGRELAYVYLPNGEFYNATLIKQGYAWAASYPPNIKYKAYFERLQAKAQKKDMPIWQIYDGKKELKDSYKKTPEYKAFKKKYGS